MSNAKIFHNSRRTSVGERVADALSKGKMDEVNHEMPGAIDVTNRASKVLLDWIKNAQVDRTLGRKCLVKVAGRCSWTWRIRCWGENVCK